MNQHPFFSQKIVQGKEEEKEDINPKVQLQKIWIRAYDYSTGATVKPKYEITDITEKKILDSNTVFLKKRGIQSVEQPIPS